MQTALAAANGQNWGPGRSAVATDRVSGRVVDGLLHLSVQRNKIHGKGSWHFLVIWPLCGLNVWLFFILWVLCSINVWINAHNFSLLFRLWYSPPYSPTWSWRCCWFEAWRFPELWTALFTTWSQILENLPNFLWVLLFLQACFNFVFWGYNKQKKKKGHGKLLVSCRSGAKRRLKRLRL